MKQLLAMLLAAAMLLMLGGCGEQKVLTCDGCGAEVKVDADSNMEDGWIVYCPECEKDPAINVSFDDNPLA